MSKNDIIDRLNKLYRYIKKYRRTVNSLNVNRISRKEIKESSKNIAQIWFENIKPFLSRFNISEEIIKKYDALFRDMISLSFKRSRKSTYLHILDAICVNYNDELIISLIEAVNPIIGLSSIQTILEKSSEAEREYLREAIGCAQHNFFRASIVLAWNASVHRVQRVLESVGFDTFNADSIILSKRTDRRYRSFNQKYNITQTSELGRRVSDTHLLIMMEYWEYIDSNQCDRLFSCYTMRCNSAHPGEAGITLPNLASFYSDIKTIIFDNPKILTILGYPI